MDAGQVGHGGNPSRWLLPQAAPAGPGEASPDPDRDPLWRMLLTVLTVFASVRIAALPVQELRSAMISRTRAGDWVGVERLARHWNN
jgi:hypothetical protein